MENKFKYIIHLADIHIRNVKRHKEYREVFEKMYTIVENSHPDTLVVLAGDIFHTKTDISPESVRLVAELFQKIADLRPLVIIMGNHDLNLSNLNRLDAITPVVENLNHSNIYYYRESGIYNLKNIDFIVWGIHDDEKNYISPLSFESNNKKIVLYHGVVNNTTLDSHMKLSSNINVNMFKGADLGLLGDIHKQQWLNEEKTIAYPSSLVAQNFGEDPINHGYILWDLETNKGEFHIVENNYGYVTIELKNNTIVNEPSYIPKNPRVRLIAENCDKFFISQYTQTLKTAININELIIQKKNNYYKSNKDIDNTLVNFRDINNQNLVLRKYYENNMNFEKDTIDRLEMLNNTINLKLENKDYSRNVIWKPIKLSFSNLFSYGENNVVDFTKLKDLVGIFAPNHSGKSSIVDILTFACFDSSLRTNKTQNILNINKDKFEVLFEFELNHQTYFIHKTGSVVKRYKKGNTVDDVKVDIDLYTIDEKGEKHSLNGEQRRDTNRTMKNLIGSIDDFLLTSLSSQNNYITFINKTQTERKNILTQFLDLSIFDELFTIANEELKEINNSLKKYEQESIISKLDEDVELLEEHEENLITLNIERDKLENKSEINQNEILNLSKNISNTVVRLDINKLNEQLAAAAEEINLNAEKSIVVKDEIKKIAENINSISKDPILINNLSIESEYKKIVFFQLELEKLKIKIQLLETDIKYKQEKLDAIGQFDPNCDFCQNTPFIRNAFKLKEELVELNTQLSDMNIQYSDIKSNLIDEEQITNKFKKLEQLNKSLSEYEKQNRILEIKLSNMINDETKLKNKLKDIKSNINLYNKHVHSLTKNEEIENNIKAIKEIDNEIKSKLKKTNDDITSTMSDIAVLKSLIKTNKESLEIIKEFSDKSSLYEVYLDSISSKDGLPYEIISQTIPNLENEINNILSQIVEFKIRLVIDDKDIETYIQYDTGKQWAVEMASGMEKFIVSLAIRVALLNISSLPRPNFLIIDEGFSNLDADSLSSLYYLFDYLKQYFDYIIIISHIDAMKDMANTSIDISQINGFSKVNHIY